MSDSNNRERSLRLFISSTFTDMNAERDALMNVFPILKEPCAQRGVNFTPIDLRWGITEAEAREGLVFESCMREIDNSRPFFIGIVGHRYGWVPTENDFGGFTDRLKFRYPWLQEAMNQGLSITEMEMQYAALMSAYDKNDKVNAIYFIRSDSADILPEYRETEGSENERKLNELKRKIRSQSKFKVFEYDDPEELARLVLQELTRFIDDAFPADFNTEHHYQEVLLSMRSNSLMGYEEEERQLVKWAKDNSSKIFCIDGAPGVGKSYMLAYMSERMRERAEKPIVVYCDLDNLNTEETIEYISVEILDALGVTARGKSQMKEMAEYAWLQVKVPFTVIRLMSKYLVDRMKVGKETAKEIYFSALPSVWALTGNPVKRLAGKLTKSLHHLSTRPVYVALDGLSKSPMPDIMKLLDFLGKFSNVKLLLTVNADSDLEEYLRTLDGCSEVKITSMSKERSCEFISNYLAQYGKMLDEEGRQLNKIAGSKIGHSPKLLKYLLDLLVCFGSFEEIDAYIDQLTSVQDETEMFRLLIRNMKSIFSGGSRDYSETAMNILAALALVPNGLTEDEMVDIFKPLPIEWSMVRPYILNLCGNTTGRFYLSVERISDAVKKEVPDSLVEVYKRVVAYFENLIDYPNFKSKIVTPSKAKMIMEMNERLIRQATVLPIIYYFGRDFDSIYRWLTYAWAVNHINDSLLSAFWEELYAAGYEMRKMDNPDVPPIYRHKNKNSPRIEKVDGVTYPQSTYGPVIRVRRQFYQRMLRVAEEYGQEADAAWLREEMAKIG